MKVSASSKDENASDILTELELFELFPVLMKQQLPNCGCKERIMRLSTCMRNNDRFSFKGANRMEE